jgi:dihydroxyacetone kinase-like protein
MMQTITLAQVRHWLLTYAHAIDQHEALLTELDAAIGDGDHGANMVRGMSKVRLWLEQNGESSPDIGHLLRTVAMTLISSIGGAAGPLYGAFFLRAAKEATGSKAVTLSHLALLFASGLEGIQQRGKAQPGEKTMIDTLAPAIAALQQAAEQGLSLAAALEAAHQAAYQGMKQTIDMEATKGRASYLGPRSIGHQDPGATSAYYLFETALQTLNTENAERRE